MNKATVGIIGFGRFGQFWAQLLKADHDVLVSDSRRELAEVASDQGLRFANVVELCAAADAFFLCVPINKMESVVAAMRPHVRPGTAIFDTCSVKSYPAEILMRHLGGIGQLELIATHPMFGPDGAAKGLSDLPMVMWPLLGATERYRDWRGYFESKGLRIVELSPDEHDRLAAYSQGVTNYIGRVLRQMNLHKTPIDTKAFELLHSVIQLMCNNSWELFHDLQHYNPYAREMRLCLRDALDHIDGMLLPERVSQEEYVIGIQGGHGGFN